MKNHARLAASVVVLVAMVLLQTPVAGAPIEVALDPNKFGKLDQKDTKCGAVGCGPTAAVNSLTYLQTAFPSAYPTPLVPAGQDVAVADSLADLMGCCGAGGTSIENFILGKRTYVESKDPGATKYGAEISGTWNGAGKPDFVHQNATAADLLGFIERELRAGEDVNEDSSRSSIRSAASQGRPISESTRTAKSAPPISSVRRSRFVRHAVSESPVRKPQRWLCSPRAWSSSHRGVRTESSGSEAQVRTRWVGDFLRSRAAARQRCDSNRLLGAVTHRMMGVLRE